LTSINPISLQLFVIKITASQNRAATIPT